MTPFDAPLPHAFGEPLHLLEPDAPWPWGGLILSALLVLALRALLRRRRVPAPAAAASAEPPPAEAPAGDFLEALIEARRRHARAGTLREGCHELAAILRSFFAGRAPAGPDPAIAGLPVDRLTLRELGTRLGDPFTTSLFELLEDLRFRRRPPLGDDLQGVYDLAAEVVQRTGDTPAGQRAAAPPERGR
ncbi:MAG: hypothetical protein MI919_34740 [Holophagales bacterium]|nr:hypothetical protein [Holophagales bacterium]